MAGINQNRLRNRLGNGDLKLKPLVPRKNAKHLLDPAEQRAEMGGCWRDFDLSGLEPREIENVVDQLEQMRTGFLDPRDIATLLAIKPGFLQQAGQAQKWRSSASGSHG